MDWCPYTFIKSKDGDILTIDGETVVKKNFTTYQDYYGFCKDNYSIFENKVRPEIQFLAERYHGIPDEEMSVPKLKTYYIDIEVHSEAGFPLPSEAKFPIVLISVRNSINGKTITFGEKEYTGDDKDVVYKHCPSERGLIESFFKFMRQYPCDVISGWNVYGFDLPYIINRSEYLWGEESYIYKFLSPIRIVKTWKQRNTDDMNIDIAGVTILDYMRIYKWYTPNNLESYSLDFVSKFELETGKLDYSEYNDLRTLYTADWNMYVDYNILDCKLVHDIDKKCGYINLIQALSLLTKAPMKYYDAMTQLIEGAMITYYRRNSMCAPYLAGGTQEHFPAAYVKEPIVGKHPWVIDIDITSSYPSHLITLNMSVETFMGRIVQLTDSQIMKYAGKKEFPVFTMYKESGPVTFEGKKLDSFNMAIKRGLVAIAPCGSVFSTKEPGVLAVVERNIFFKRKEVKGRMKVKRKEGNEERANQLFDLQWALKILLNAMFGILAVPYSRYFNVDIAEAITSCGKFTILKGQDFVNEWFKQFDYNLPEDLVAYIDTDSLFIRFGEYFKHTDGWEEKSDEEKIEIIREMSAVLENYVNNRVFNEVQKEHYNSQVDDFKIEFKQEIVAKSALFIKKKKYAYWCVNEEGTPVDKLKVTGLDLVRSESSEAIRTRLKDVMEMIMKDSSDTDIRNKIMKYKRELKNVIPEEIAANISVNGISKYIVDGKPTKGTPWHVKGVASYRLLLKEFGIEEKYEDIYEGPKAKVVYVKKNRYNVETITFHRWPKEFENAVAVDMDTMIDKFFVKKIGFLLEPMKKMDLLDNKKKALNMFFG